MAVIDDVAGTEKVRLYDKGVDLSNGMGAAGPAGTDIGIPADTGTSSGGTHTIGGTQIDFATAMSIRSGDISIPKIPVREPLRIECEHFVSCILGSREPLSDGENGRRVVEILSAARMSMERGGEKVAVAPESG